LFESRGKGTLIDTRQAFVFQNVFQARDKGLIEFNAFGFDSFDRCHNDQGFRHTRTQTGQKIFARRQRSVFFIAQFVFNDGIQTKSNPRFGNTSNQGGCQSSVERQETSVFDSIGQTRNHAIVGKFGAFGFGLKLELCLIFLYVLIFVCGVVCRVVCIL